MFDSSSPEQRSEDDLKNILQEIRRSNELLQALVQASGSGRQTEQAPEQY